VNPLSPENVNEFLMLRECLIPYTQQRACSSSKSATVC